MGNAMEEKIEQIKAEFHRAAGAGSDFEKKFSLYWLFLSVTMLVLVLPGIWLVGAPYHGSADLHAAIEVVGSVIAIMAGVILIFRYPVFSNRMHLLIGLAFFINGAEDLVHGLMGFLGSREIIAMPFGTLERFLPATYVAGRIMMAVLLILAPFSDELFGVANSPQKEAIRLSFGAVVLMAMLTIMSYYASLPVFIYPLMPLSRPVDMVSALLFAVAFFIMLRYYQRHGDVILKWLLLAIVFHLTGQILMSFSKEMYDGFFDIAHLYKVIGYALPLIGMSQYQTQMLRFALRWQKMSEELELIVQQQLESARQTSEKFRALVETASDWIWETDKKAVYTFVGPQCRELLGYDPEEIVGKTLYDFMPNEEAGKMGDIFSKMMAKREPLKRFVNTNLHKDGHHVVFETSGVPFFDNTGNLAGYRGIDRDITERIADEEERSIMETQLKRSNEELQQFAYLISHDLQEPLRMVSSYVGLLKKRYQGKLDSDADDFIRFAVDGATRMSDMIEGLLQFSRVQSKGRELVPTDMTEVVQSVLKNLEVMIKESGAEVNIDLLATVWSDKNQMIQLLQNLICNAIKFKKADTSCRVEVGCRCEAGMCTFWVRDNGVGFDMKYKEKIFEIYQRLDGGRSVSGSGMGLAIAKRIVERHGGSIWAESVPGTGSTFFFTLKAVLEEQQ
jgi:PAS domain S-box-containing protein